MKFIDLVIFFLNKFNSQSRPYNENDLKNAKNEIKYDNKEFLKKNDLFKMNDLFKWDDLFKLNDFSKMNDFLKNDSIFEELENRYSNNISSSLSNSSYRSQNIFTSLKNNNHENIEMNREYVNIENHRDYENIEKNRKYVNIENHRNYGNIGNHWGSDSNENKLIEQSNNFYENIKEKMICLLLNNRDLDNNESNIYDSILRIIAIFFSILTIIVALVSYFISLELGLAIFISFALIAFAISYYPKIKKQNDSSSFSKELPYALRQLATELKSGKSLFDSMGSIVDSDYGVLSLEFARVLEEIKYGESAENAFLNLERRLDSKGLSRVIYEILTSLRIGSNLSGSLSIIAEDVNFDLRMKLKEYSEKLNAFVMIYTFLAILAPVILLTMLLASSVVIGDLVPGELVLILYSVFFPMIIVFLGFAIKKLEPKI